MNSLLLIFLCLFSSGKSQKSQLSFTETVDKIEINTCHDEFLQKFRSLEIPIVVPIYRQIIFYEWNPEYNRYDVMCWKMVETAKEIKDENRKCKWYSGLNLETNYHVNKIGDYYYLYFNHNGKKFIIRSKNIQYTDCLSRNDPERLNKHVFEEKFRKNFLN